MGRLETGNHLPCPLLFREMGSRLVKWRTQDWVQGSGPLSPTGCPYHQAIQSGSLFSLHSFSLAQLSPFLPQVQPQQEASCPRRSSSLVVTSGRVNLSNTQAALRFEPMTPTSICERAALPQPLKREEWHPFSHLEKRLSTVFWTLDGVTSLRSWMKHPIDGSSDLLLGTLIG